MIETQAQIKPTINHPGRVLNSIHKEQIKDDLVKQIPQREIATKFGVTQGRIHQIKKANENEIELKQQEIMAELPSVIETIKNDIDTNNKLSQDINKDYKQITPQQVSLKTVLDKNNVNVLKITRILDSNTIQYGDTNIQNNTVVSPAFQSYIDYQSNNPDVVDTKGDTIDGDN